MKFFEALFDGTMALNAYTPDVGAISTETIDLQNGFLTNRFSPQPLSTMSVADGFLKFPSATLNGKTLVLKLTPSPSADYYVEVEFDGNPEQSVINLAIALRASTMTVAPWHASAKNYIGAQYSFYDGAGTTSAYYIWASDGTYDYNYFDTTGLPDATDTFIVRAEVIGSTVKVYVDGVQVQSHTTADPNIDAEVIGDIYVLMELYLNEVQSSGGFLQVPIRRITGETAAEPPPEPEEPAILLYQNGDIICEPFDDSGPLTDPPWQSRTNLTFEDGSDYPATLAGDTLVVDGELTMPGAFSQIVLEHETAMPTQNYWVEVVFAVDPATEASAYVKVMTRVTVGTNPAEGPVEVNAICVEVGTFIGGGILVECRNEFQGGGGVASWFNNDSGAVALADGEQEVRFRIEIEGTFVRVYCNNVLVGNGDYSEHPTPDPGELDAYDEGTRMMFRYYRDTANMTLFNVGNLPYGGPGIFWKDFVESQEIVE